MTPGPDMEDRDPGPDMEERDPGLARERTALAWTRTAISVAALGGAMLKTNLAARGPGPGPERAGLGDRPPAAR